VVLVAFVALEARVADPLLTLRVPRDRSRGGAYAAMAIIGAARFACGALMTPRVRESSRGLDAGSAQRVGVYSRWLSSKHSSESDRRSRGRPRRRPQPTPRHPHRGPARSPRERSGLRRASRAAARAQLLFTAAIGPALCCRNASATFEPHGRLGALSARMRRGVQRYHQPGSARATSALQPAKRTQRVAPAGLSGRRLTPTTSGSCTLRRH
jgi:hypothetical protein